MTISFHPAITLIEAAKVADYLDCRLIQDGSGNVVITPRESRPTHTNAPMYKFPHRHGQYGATLPGHGDAA